MLPNLHPVDQLARVRTQIRELQLEEGRLRVYVLEHEDDRTGDHYRAVVRPRLRNRLDLKGLISAVGGDVLRRFTSWDPFVVVQLIEREDMTETQRTDKSKAA
jgi:hypothetical protein